MVKYWFKLITLADLMAWGKRHAVKFLLAASLLACFGMDQAPNDPPITYTVNGYTVVRPSEMGPLNGALNNATPYLVPISGSPAGAISYTVNGYTVVRPSEMGPLNGALNNATSYLIPISGSPAGAISYTVNGYTVVRPSEMGPLTGTTFDNPHPAVGPGHDYGAIEK